VFSASDVVVISTDTTGAETTLALGTNYTVTLNSNQDSNPGGTVNMLVAPAVGYLLTLTSALPYLQSVLVTNGGGFYPAIFNDVFDRHTIFAQQLSDAVSRSLKISISTPEGVDSTLPSPVPYQLIGWNGTGTGLQNTDPTYSTALATDLASAAAGKGAALVGFTQPGTGAVARTVASKFGDTVSVLDFMTSAQISDVKAGTASIDVSGAIQAAINYMATLTRGGDMLYPSGKYLISSPILQTSQYIRHIGEGILKTLFVTTTDIVTITIGSNPITSLYNVDILDIGFYHTNTVVRVNPHIIALSPMQSTFRCWLSNGAFGIDIYGGQGIRLQLFSSGNYDTGTNPVLNSISAVRLFAATDASGYTNSTGVVLPTEVDFNDIYINGPSLKGFQNAIAIYAGEHITFSGDYYVGQSTISNVRLEQTAANNLILEVKLEKGGYIDAAGAASVYITGSAGNGSQYIGSVTIDCDIKGQSGTGQRGIYVDGTVRAGSFQQVLYNLTINSDVSGHALSGIEIQGAVNTNINNPHVWGNSFNTVNNGYGIYIGPGVAGCYINGGASGGGTYGSGTGNQSAGIYIHASAVDVIVDGTSLRYNQSSLAWTPNSQTSRNRITNCPGYNGNLPSIAPTMPASTVNFTNPYGTTASVLIYGGTVTSIKLNGTQLFSTTVNAPITVAPDDVLNITYSAAPSWTWWRM
jgi:hypothetical protein